MQVQKKYSFFLIIGFALILLANSGNPPNGRTGAPGEGTCGDCHSLGGGTQNGAITLAGFPASIVPNQAYVLTITASNPNGVADEAGFQLVVLNSSNQNTGDLSSPGTGSTTQTASGREYWEHNPSQVFPASNLVSWTVTWTAPTGPANEAITWYTSANIANGNNSTSGDLIVLNSGTGTLAGGGSPLSIVISASVNVLCNGGNSGSATAQASGGTMPYTYLWSHGQSGPVAANLGAGTYSVTVTDNTGSTATTSVIITQPAAINFSAASITPVSCFGGADGAITAAATGGIPPYLFQWSNGAAGASVTGLSAGNYSLTVTDDNGCSKTTSYMVSQPAALNINLVNLQDESCFGEADGSITISASGGTSPYFAEWSNGFIGNMVSGLEPGSYTVIVTDNNDCTATAQYTIAPGNQVDVDLVSIQNVSCFGGMNGSIQVSGNGGDSPYSYVWSTGAITPLVTGLAAGSYLVTVTDAGGCEVIKLYTITQPAQINLSITQSSGILCAGDSTAALTVQATGGGPFTYLWSTGDVTAAVAGLPAGMYGVTVTNASDCTNAASFSVSEPNALAVTVTTEDESAPGAQDGTASAVATGGTPPYAYLWSNGSTAEMITGLAPGVYSITVTDANDCEIPGQGQVDPFGCALSVDLGGDLSLCAGSQGLLIPSVNGASGTVAYAWSTGSTEDTLLIFAPGEYCITVSDEIGCQDVDCILVALDTVPLLNCGVTPESSAGASDGSIVCDENPAIVSYVWSTGATTPSITGLATGEYCVTLTNANGCTAVQCFLVQPANCNLVITALLEDVLCFADTTGFIALNVENAELPVRYAWSNGDSTATIANLGAGPFEVTITDGAGCIEVRSYAITQPDQLIITVDSILPVTDVGQGALYITVSGGMPPFGYVWTLPDGSQSTDQDLTGLTTPGSHIITVTDASGCRIIGLFEVSASVAVPMIPVSNRVNVFPVPATDWLQIALPGSSARQVWLHAIDGRLLARYDNPPANWIDVSRIESGLYVLIIHDGQTWYVARMIK